MDPPFTDVYKREAMCAPRLRTSGVERVHMLLIKIITREEEIDVITKYSDSLKGQFRDPCHV